MLVRFLVLMILFVVTADRGIMVSPLMLILPLITRAVLPFPLLVLHPQRAKTHQPLIRLVLLISCIYAGIKRILIRIISTLGITSNHILDDAVKSCDNLSQESIDT